MADETASSRLVAETIPKIIITQPSPLKRGSSEASLDCACVRDSPCEEPLDLPNDDEIAIQEFPPPPPSPVVERKSPSETELNSMPSSDFPTGETDSEMPVPFSRSIEPRDTEPLGVDSIEDDIDQTQPKSIQCGPEVSAPEPSVELRVDMLHEETETPDAEVPDSRIATEDNWTCGWLHWLFYRWSELAKSQCRFILWILLMPLPISTGFMGARYLNECRMSHTTPVFLFIMGVTGVVVLTAIVISIIREETWEEFSQPCLHMAIGCGLGFFLVIFLTEVMSFWRFSPSWDVISPMYCNPTFYDFTYWMNWTTITLFLFVLVWKLVKYLIQRQRSH